MKTQFTKSDFAYSSGIELLPAKVCRLGVLAFVCVMLTASFYSNPLNIQPHRYTFGGKFLDFTDRHGSYSQSWTFDSLVESVDFDGYVCRSIDYYIETGRLIPFGYIGAPSSRVQPADPGFQAYILSLVSRWTRLSGQALYASSTLAFSLLTAGVICLLLNALLREFPWQACLLFAVLVALSDWLVLLGRSLYWCQFASILPYAFAWVVYPRVREGRCRMRTFLVIAGGIIAAKCLLGGYEFLSNIILSATIPIVYTELRSNVRFSTLVRRVVQVSLAGAAGAAMAMVLHISFLANSMGSTHHAIAEIANHALARTYGGNQVAAAATQFDRLPTGARHFPLVALKLSAYLLNSVVTIPLPHFTAIHIYLVFPLVLTVGLLVWSLLRNRRLGKVNPNTAALQWCVSWSLLVSLSWVVLFPGHMTPHLHFATIAFCFPWLLTLKLWGSVVIWNLILQEQYSISSCQRCEPGASINCCPATQIEAIRSEIYQGIKVGIQIRTDHASKVGGDIALAKAFAGRLRLSGFQVELVSSARVVQSLRPHLLIAFNLDQPLELLDLCRAAKHRGAEVAVYALHHPSQGVRAYLQSGLSGARGWVARLVGNDPARYFYEMALLRGFRSRNFLALKYMLLGRDRLRCDLAPLIDHLLVSGPSELAEVQTEFPELRSADIRIVSHPVEISGIAVPEINPYDGTGWRRHFFIGGRIESRKNQNAVLRVAARVSDSEFVFAGKLNETDPTYCAEFRRLLTLAPNCRWLGQLSMAALLQHIAYADAVVSPSWFEVMSLINLYAYSLGTPIISARHTYDPDLLRDSVTRYDPEAPHALLDALTGVGPRIAPKVAAYSDRIAEFSALTWIGFDEFSEFVGERLAATR
jgi:glycosyltransferase involved in cell wall biosynthesis